MIILVVIAIFFRLYGINWDLGFHLHPDERMLMIVADRMNFFSNLNPEFFNYGTLPLYILKAVAQIIDVFRKGDHATYDGMLYLGRFLSIVADIGTIICIYKIVLRLFKKKDAALYSAFIYSFAFFTIQNTHFFVVDVFLTFFLTASLYFLIVYLEKRSWKVLVLLAASYGAALATKFTAILFFPFFIILLLPFGAIFFLPLTILFHFIFMPYAYLSWPNFFHDVSQQSAMSRDAYVFPYTLQYVYTLPYLYFVKNIILWGLGPFISILAGFGIIEYWKVIRKKRVYIIVAVFYVFYFIVLGISAVKFMRYMLPVYPFLAILAGLGLKRIKQQFGKYVFIAAIALVIAWTGLFVNIYSQQHTRLAATNWILQNIPAGSTLAIEHWDDRLPLTGSERYNFVELTLYDQPDDDTKWQVLKNKLSQANYIIIASNRLFVPLQKLADCKRYKVCYPKTAQYYRDLFGGKLRFKQVYEAHVYPSITILGHTLGIDDQTADESFTVYDHPKIMIFKKK